MMLQPFLMQIVNNICMDCDKKLIYFFNLLVDILKNQVYTAINNIYGVRKLTRVEL